MNRDAAYSGGGDRAPGGLGQLRATETRPEVGFDLWDLLPPGRRRAPAEWGRGIGFFALWVLLAVAALRPLMIPHPVAPEAARGFPGWPDEFEGRPLVAIPPSVREARFAAGFPGRVAAFGDGGRTIVLRWLAGETRKLHPAVHCLRGLGYAVRPGLVFVDRTGCHWGTVTATKAGHPWRVRERIADGAGREWTDVSSWWWDAWRRRSAGPWWVVTVIEPG